VPTDDPRLERFLHDVAPTVGTTGVVERIAQRRTRRRRNRRLAATALALVLLLVVGTVTVLVTRDDGSSPHVAAPGAHLQARVITGDAPVDDGAGKLVDPTRVALDIDPHLLRAPVFAGATALSVASYDPGPDGVALSHVVRIEDAHVVDILDFKAHVLSITEGEGARWALTRNLRTTGGRVPDSFLKRIPATGEAVSMQLPVDSDPVGPVAAVGGAVWVPIRDGVLEYDPTGAFVRKVLLPDATNRSVAQVGKFAYATDGNRLHALDVAGAGGDTITFGPEILGLAAAGFDSRVLLAAEGGGREHARVARATSGSPVAVTAVLPDGFIPNGLAASTTRVWATGTVDGAPAVALLGDHGVQATVVLENASDDAALAWTSAHTVRVVSGGILSDLTVP
jgi:hypothetical protein